MKTILVLLFFSGLAVYVSSSLVRIQLSPTRTTAFMAIAVATLLMFLRLQLPLYLIIASVSFFDPRYWMTFLRLWLHQWIIMAGLIILIIHYLHKRQRFFFRDLDFWLLGFLLTFLISLTNSPDLLLGIKWIIYLLVFLAAYYLLRLCVTGERELKMLIIWLIICGVASSLISYTRAVGGNRVGSLVLTNPNALGNYLSMILPMAIALGFFSTFSGWKKNLLVLGAGAIIISIILTYSRSSWLGTLLGLLVLFVFRPRIKYLLFLVILIAVLSSISTVRHRIFEDSADAGIVYRQSKIELAYSMFKEKPILGYGPGGFQAIAPTMEDWGIHAHSAIENLYMQMLAEGGLLQVSVFLGLIIFVTRMGLKTIKVLPDGFLRAAMLGSLASFWAVLGIGIGENSLFFPLTNWLVGFHLAVMIKVREFAGLYGEGTVISKQLAVSGEQESVSGEQESVSSDQERVSGERSLGKL